MEDGQQHKYKIAAVIQARMGSTRLPGKILKKLPYSSKTTIIDVIIDRIGASKYINAIEVVTSINKKDDQLENHIKTKNNISLFRGDENDVLSRFVAVQSKFKYDYIVRLTADNPCVHHELIDKVINDHIEKKADYTYSISYPLGMNIEVISGYCFENLQEDKLTLEEKEHVTLFFKNNPNHYKLNFFKDFHYSGLDKLRLTVDTKEDYLTQCALFKYFQPNIAFNLDDIVMLYEREHWIFEINKEIIQKKV
ncbi:uncharacterized protein UJ101_00319 [Flavobacteriaceae bacterium UJ101]|nr:uncharacterized protein UJ101_00319 [Flavobacteriaceae bacterium UJ101]